MLNEKPASALTEDDLNKLASNYKGYNPILLAVIDSHRVLHERNAKLVHENDELMAENVKYKSLVAAVLKAHRERGVIMTEACGDREVVSLAYELEESK